MRDLDLLRLQRRTDKLIAPWSDGKTPGVTIGIVRAGALVLHRYAGFANLDLAVPIGPDTTFRVASVTKQFTCAGILLLALEGRLDLADEIHVHLPDLPDFGAPVTIDHLMHNTSGIRDFLELMRLGGMDLRQPCQSDDVMQVLVLQRGLNFPPGSQFLYSNTNFLLLGLIVEKLSGQPIHEFAEQRIFAPLGMTSSRFVESTAEIVPGLATGYFPSTKGGFVKAEHGFPLGGEGGLVSSVEDLALWDRNLTTCQVGGEALVANLIEQAPFTGGGLNSYARGLAIKSYRDLRTISHGGLWPGYRTEFLRVPACELTVICITNLGSVVPYSLARAVVDAALERDRLLQVLSPPPIRPLQDDLAGRYVDPDGPATLDIELSPKGTPTVTCNGVPFTLIPDREGRFVADASTFDLAVIPTPEGLLVETVPDQRIRFKRAPAEPKFPDGLAGRYRCDEVGSTWTIAPDASGGLHATATGPMVTGRSWEVAPIADDIVRIWTPNPLYRSWFDVRIDRDADGIVRARAVNGGRTRGHVFLRER